VGLVSCDNDDPINSIIIEKNNITVWVGKVDSIAVFSTNDLLSIKSDNEQIASAYFKNNYIVINAHDKSGKTILRLKDRSDREATIEVYVQTLFGAWREIEISRYKCEVIIDAEDKIIRESLKQSLWESAARRLRTTYGFYANTTKVEIITRDGERIEGEYQFSSEKLVLSYDKKTEIYEVSLLGLRFIQITQNLTEYYREQYPNAGIKNLLVNRYLQFISL
jgi:hypothetical protein